MVDPWDQLRGSLLLANVPPCTDSRFRAAKRLAVSAKAKMVRVTMVADWMKIKKHDQIDIAKVCHGPTGKIKSKSQID